MDKNKTDTGSKITLEQIKEIFDFHFVEPFLAKGIVETKFITHTKQKTLQIKIGRRDIWLEESGRVVGSGTDVTKMEEL